MTQKEANLLRKVFMKLQKMFGITLLPIILIIMVILHWFAPEIIFLELCLTRTLLRTLLLQIPCQPQMQDKACKMKKKAANMKIKIHSQIIDH